MRKYEAKLVIYELRVGRRIPEFNYCDLVRTEEYIEKGDSNSAATCLRLAVHWVPRIDYMAIEKKIKVIAKALYSDFVAERNIDSSIRKIPVEELALPTRTRSALRNFNVDNVGDIFDADQQIGLKKIPKLGKKGIQLIKSKLEELGIN